MLEMIFLGLLIIILLLIIALILLMIFIQRNLFSTIRRNDRRIRGEMRGLFKHYLSEKE